MCVGLLPPLANTAGGVLLQTWLALSTITLAQQSPLPCPKRYQGKAGGRCNVMSLCSQWPPCGASPTALFGSVYEHWPGDIARQRPFAKHCCQDWIHRPVPGTCVWSLLQQGWAAHMHPYLTTPCTACCVLFLSQGQFNDFDARYAVAARRHLADSSSNLLFIPRAHATAGIASLASVWSSR